MYAFVKIDDPKTSLSKYVLINWQGEGANTVRKGLCANHLRDIEKFFTGAHLTINARNDEEVEPDLIISKVAKAGSAYSFKAPRGDVPTVPVPIGTNYQRVNPIKEINSRERDQFWLKEEQEEKKRVEEERKRKEFERLKMEEEVKRRELAETVERDAKTYQRNNSIDQIKKAEQVAFKAQKVPESNAYDDQSDVRVNRSDLLREERNKEAQELISQRTIDARSIFEKNTVAGQIKKAPEKPVRASILKAQAQSQANSTTNKNNLTDENKNGASTHSKPEESVANKIEEFQSDDESDQFSTIKRCPKDSKSATSPTVQQESFKNEINNAQTTLNSKQETVQITEQQFVDEVIYGDLNDPGIQARALYDYQAGKLFY